MARILIVDDDPAQLRVRGQLLRLWGHEVQAASTRDEAVRLLGSRPPQVLLVDLRVPTVEDGLTIIRAAAAQPSPPRIVVLSGWPEALYDRPEAGLVARVLLKPVRTAELLEAIGLTG